MKKWALAASAAMVWVGSAQGEVLTLDAPPPGYPFSTYIDGDYKIVIDSSSFFYKHGYFNADAAKTTGLFPVGPADLPYPSTGGSFTLSRVDGQIFGIEAFRFGANQGDQQEGFPVFTSLTVDGLAMDGTPYFRLAGHAVGDASGTPSFAEVTSPVPFLGVTAAHFSFNSSYWTAFHMIDSISITTEGLRLPPATAVPAPLAGAGLPALLALAGGWFWRWRRYATAWALAAV
jgi:hypothetical protein